MENDFTYEDIIDILSSNGVDLTNVKIELTNVVRKHTNLNLIHPVALKSLVRKISKRAMLNKNTSTIQIFTDGSCLQNDSKHPGTFGLVVVLNNKIVFEYSDYNEVTTNNEMELSAVIIASQIGQYLTKFAIKTLIHSDSQYSVNTLFGTWSGETNKYLQELFETLKVDKEMVNCEWIKAHDGNILNEYCDKLCALEYNKVEGYYVTRKN